MKNKNLIYIAIGIFLFLIIGSLFAGFSKNNGNVSRGEKDFNLEKYRGENIPENCRLPEYERNVQSWKEHLSHHQNTLYCLEYYADVEAIK